MNLISTIIPVYNRPVMIRDAVQSVLAQTHRPIEIVLVDDGSTDSTPEVLESLAQKHPEVVVVRQQNAGPGAARNTGLIASHGTFIQYLDSDDLLHPEKFERQLVAFHRRPEAGVCYCVTHRKDPKSNEMVPWARTAEQIDDIFPSFLPKRGWATLTPLWRRSVCEAIGPWKPYRVMEDWEHDLRAGLLGVVPVRVPEVLCTVVDHQQARASGMNEGYTTERVRDLFLSHESIWGLMKAAGKTDWSYLNRFSRTMFWIARMCGQRGLYAEAERAVDCTDQMTQCNNQPSATRRFRQLKRVLGWKLSVKIGEWLSEQKK